MLTETLEASSQAYKHAFYQPCGPRKVALYLVAGDIRLHPGIPLKVATHIDRKDQEHSTLLPEGLVELFLVVLLQSRSETQGEPTTLFQHTAASLQGLSTTHTSCLTSCPCNELPR